MLHDAAAVDVEASDQDVLDVLLIAGGGILRAHWSLAAAGSRANIAMAICGGDRVLVAMIVVVRVLRGRE